MGTWDFKEKRKIIPLVREEDRKTGMKEEQSTKNGRCQKFSRNAKKLTKENGHEKEKNTPRLYLQRKGWCGTKPSALRTG